MIHDKNVISNVVTVILVICAVIMTVVVVREYVFAAPATTPTTRHVDHWRNLVNGRHVSIGRGDAPLKIVEFSDFQCPYCRRLNPNLQLLVAHSGGKGAVIRYALPLTYIHPSAYEAALAAKCAELQGVYGRFQSSLFNAALENIDWKEIGNQANIRDTGLFLHCIKAREAAKMVADDVDVADRLGIKGTPTLIVNGYVIPGMESEQSLRRLVSREVAKLRPD